MANAIVINDSPKAKETPSQPIPTPGTPAARTALPQPANTSQNVPSISAAIFRVNDIATSLERIMRGSLRRWHHRYLGPSAPRPQPCGKSTREESEQVGLPRDPDLHGRKPEQG